MKKNVNHVSNNQDVILSTLQQVYDLIRENNINEVAVNIDNINFKIKRYSPKNFTPTVVLQQTESVIENKDKNVVQQETMLYDEIVSPINGVFYRSPSPGAPPFVNEGDIVSPGSVLCIVEAMKIMNEIKADKKCRIVKILCENGSSVSVGTKLFLVEPL